MLVLISGRFWAEQQGVFRALAHPFSPKLCRRGEMPCGFTDKLLNVMNATDCD